MDAWLAPSRSRQKKESTQRDTGANLPLGSWSFRNAGSRRRSCMRSRLLGHLVSVAMSTAAAVRPKPCTSAGRPVRPGTLPVVSVLQTADNSLKRTLRGDPKSDKLMPNDQPREIFGQWVDVVPSKLPNPFVVALAPTMAAELGLDQSAAEDPLFARCFSGDVAAAKAAGAPLSPWATPYAVSVFGQAIPSPDPFGGGTAYGDGRACSLGEFMAPPLIEGGPSQRWELQLKGSGTTPFSRGGDGRAVLRSSIREYLVSEAMEAMGVPTTRALCLVASGSQYTRRMWYRPDDTSRDHPPDTMVEERCAITCRAAPSFLRVGHLELWSRRAGRGVEGAAAELAALVDHAISREFAEEVDTALPRKEQLYGVLRAFAARQAQLAVSWLRVGYVQGNMNSDNCLLSGRTMDYGERRPSRRRMPPRFACRRVPCRRDSHAVVAICLSICEGLRRRDHAGVRPPRDLLRCTRTSTGTCTSMCVGSPHR